MMRIPKGHSVREEIITPEEYVAMLSVLPCDTLAGLRDNVIVRLLYDTGARVGELQQLNGETFGKDKRYLTIQTEKTPDSRIISWSNDTHAFLLRWQEVKGRYTPIIPSIRTCQRIIQTAALSAGIQKRIHPHLFRHTKAHKILDTGGGLQDVQDILGHRHIGSSLKYIRWNEEKRMARRDVFFDEVPTKEYTGMAKKEYGYTPSTKISIRSVSHSPPTQGAGFFLQRNHGKNARKIPAH